MTSSSKARVARRSAEKAIANKLAYKPGDPAKSVITLTEVPGTGGFTIGLGLHGARMEELFPGVQQPVSLVDVLALAITTVVRQQPQDFQDAVALVDKTLREVNAKIAEGVDPIEAMAAADVALSGAVNDVEVPETSDDIANVG